MEESLKESEEKFRTIAEQALMGIFIIQDDLLKYVNQYMLDLTDYSLEEVRNWKVGEFLNLVHPEDRNLAKEQSSKKQQGLENVIAHYSVRLLKKNGETIWVDNYSKTINYNGRPADLATMVDVTEKVLAEKRIKESEERYRTLFDNTPFSIVIFDSNGTIIDFNSSTERLFGYKRDELVGLHYSALSTYNKEQIPKINKRYEKLLRGEIPDPIEIECIKKDGSKFWGLSKILPVKLGEKTYFQGMIQDITEKKDSEQKLKDSEENYRSVFNYSPDYIYLTDMRGDFLDANQTLLEKLRIPIEELKGMNFVDFYAGDNLNKIMDVVKELGFGKEVMGLELKAKGPAGNIIDVEINSVPIKEKEKVVKVLNFARDVTERKISEQKLRESEEKHKNMIDGLDLGFYQIRWDGSILNLNPAFRRIMGYDEIIDLSKINLRNFWKKDEDRKIFVKELLKNNHIENFIGLGKNYRGQELYLQMHSHLTRDKEGNPIRLEGTIADITEKFKLEQKLKRSELRYRILFENSPFGIMLLDTNAIIREVNPAVEKMSGYKKEEFIGRSYANLSIVDQEFLPILLERTKKLSMDQPVTPIDVKLYKKDGTPFWVQFLSLTIKIGDELFIQTMIMDITERKTADILIKEEVDKLKELDQIRKDLISRVSHELKTPLIPVIGGAELLQHLYKDKFDSESLELIQMIEKGGKRLSKLVEKLLDVTRIEFNKLELDLQKTDLSEIIRNSVETMKYLIEKRKIQFNLVIPKEFYLEIDGNRIEQVITNLLSNALKNTPPDGRVSLLLEKYDNWAILSVSDTGVGFTEEEMKKIFTRFGKIERYEEGLEYIEIDGSGLGLYISKQIVELHGGKIWVESDGRNKGCIFKVRISIQ
jgi:PAS domain S-box-containing protein